MTAPLALGPEWLNPDTLLTDFGDLALWGAALVIFAECGLLLGFFLPGDSLLFTLGLFIGRGDIHTPLWLACLVLTLAAFIGNVVGYEIGRASGPAIFSRGNSRIFKQEYVDKTMKFFDTYGARAIVLARFVPIVRTFAPFVAGIGKMSYFRFALFNVVGGVTWILTFLLAGWIFGNVKVVKENFELVAVAIVAISLLPIAFEVLKVKLATPRAEPVPVGGDPKTPEA